MVYKLAFKIDDHHHVSWCRPSSYSLGQSISRFIADLLFSLVLELFFLIQVHTYLHTWGLNMF